MTNSPSENAATKTLKAPISVIMVTFNAEPFIESTIQSVIKHSQDIAEFIIIDGCSTDNTVDIIKKYQDHLTYWLSEPDKGIYDAMNKGWNRADINNHILFLGAGDSILSLPKEVLAPNTVYFGDVIIGESRFTSKKDGRLKIGNTLHHQALLIPKKLHAESPFNADYKIYGDFDFNQRLLKSKTKFIKSGMVSYVLPDGVSQHYKTMEWYDIIKKNFGLGWAVVGYIYYKFQAIRNK